MDLVLNQQWTPCNLIKGKQCCRVGRCVAPFGQTISLSDSSLLWNWGAEGSETITLILPSPPSPHSPRSCADDQSPRGILMFSCFAPYQLFPSHPCNHIPAGSVYSGHHLNLECKRWNFFLISAKHHAKLRQKKVICLQIFSSSTKVLNLKVKKLNKNDLSLTWGGD